MNKVKSTLTILKQARALIKKGWTQHVAARNKYGHRVAINSNSACRFCASAALERVSGDNSRQAHVILDWMTGAGLILFNDHFLTKKSDVLALFDKAIAQEKNRK